MYTIVKTVSIAVEKKSTSKQTYFKYTFYCGILTKFLVTFQVTISGTYWHGKKSERTGRTVLSNLLHVCCNVTETLDL